MILSLVNFNLVVNSKILVSILPGGIIAIFFLSIGLGIVKTNNYYNKGESKEPNYTELFKEKIVKQIIENEFEGAKYYPNSGLTGEQYRKAGYKEYYDRFHSDDLVVAPLTIKEGKNTTFTFSDVHTEQETTDSDGHTSYSTIFSGLAGSFELSKSINTGLYIRSNGRVGFWNKEKVGMDMSDFEKIFDVESNDKIFAMRILTPDIMTEILDLYRKYKYRFEISIINDTVYMRLMTGRMFEPNLFGKAMDYKVVEKYFLVLKALADIATHIYTVIDDIEI